MKISHWLKIAIAVLLFSAFQITSARAETISLLSGNGPVGTRDPINQFTLDSGSTWQNAYILPSYSYYSLIPGTRYINRTSTNSGPTFSSTRYRAAFQLPDIFGSPNLSVSVFADNVATVYLNGVKFGQQPFAEIYPNFEGTPSLFSISDPQLFKPGTNYLEFDIYNFSGPTAFDYAAAVTYGGCVNPPSGMVAWWPGDGNGIDISGGNNGALINGASFADGKVGQAFSFDGVNDRVEVPSSAKLNITGPLTIDAWFRLTAPLSSMGSPVVAKWGDSLYGGAGYGLFVLGSGYPMISAPDGKVAFSVSSTGGDIHLVASPSPLTLNEWHHLAGVYDGSALELYVDGILTAVQAYSGGVHATSAPLVMGSYNPGYTSFVGPLKGEVDEVEIFSRALSTEEIRSVYYAQSAGKCKPQNLAPIADAGPDQTVQCSGNGASVMLNGSGSSDPDNDPLTYSWTWPGGSAEGINPSVTLPLGTTIVTLTVDDGKGGTATDTVSITVQDTTPPSTTASLEGTQGNNGWYVSDVTATLTSTDNCSGCNSIDYVLNGLETSISGNSATIAITGNGVNDLSFHATDKAGNVEQTKTVQIKIDKTAPTINASATPAPNANGWNNTDVTVTFSCSDSVSGVALCTSPVTVTTEGAGQEVCGTAADNAGNSAKACVTLNIDKTPPTADISLAPGLLWPPDHKMVNVAVNGGATDPTSGITSIEFTVVDEYGTVQPSVSGFNTTIPLESWREGTDMDGRHYTITAVITDKAGNIATVSTEAICPHDMRGKQ